MIKIDRNMFESWQIYVKKYNFNISTFVGSAMWIVYYCTTWITLKNHFAFADMYNDDKQLTFQDPPCDVNEK